MHIDESEDPSFLIFCIFIIGLWISKLAHQSLDRDHSRVQLFFGIKVLAIEVVTCHVGSIVANDDPVWIRHGNDIEHTSLPELSRLQTVPQKVLNEALHHV